MRAITAHINVENLRNNVHTIRSQSNSASMIAMIKANAYGHGIVECARIFEQEGVEKVGVAYIHEAMMLRKAGIAVPVLVFTPPEHDDPRLYAALNAEAVVWSENTAKMISKAAQAMNTTVKVHLSIETGMNRDGVRYADIPQLLKSIYHLPGLQWEGIFSHFATSEGDDDAFFFAQLKEFKAALELVNAMGYAFRLVHSANSGAIFRNQDSIFNCVRPGIALYGYAPFVGIRHIDLRPALSLTTKVVSHRRIRQGETVSYGRFFKAEQDTTIATIPVGYGDGWSRTISGIAKCLVRGKRYPIVGAICMDCCMVNIGDEAIETGEEVVLIGQQGEECISAEEVGKWRNTICYEVLSTIAARVERKYE